MSGSPCQFRTPLLAGIIRCEWLSVRIGSGINREVSRCKKCQDAGPPSLANVELRVHGLQAALTGRVIMYESNRDEMFGGLTAEVAAERLKELGVGADELVSTLIHARERGMDVGRAVAIAERIGVADDEWEGHHEGKGPAGAHPA